MKEVQEKKRGKVTYLLFTEDIIDGKQQLMQKFRYILHSASSKPPKQS
jgi:hypothetical protein